jgi:hypothetical protein
MPRVICAAQWCRRPIAGEAESRRVEVRRVGTAEVAFGEGAKAGPLEAGLEYPLLQVYHNKCWIATAKRARLVAARSADPSGHRAGSDWHDQETADVEDLRGGVARADGGAGPAPG